MFTSWGSKRSIAASSSATAPSRAKASRYCAGSASGGGVGVAWGWHGAGMGVAWGWLVGGMGENVGGWGWALAVSQHAVAAPRQRKHCNANEYQRMEGEEGGGGVEGRQGGPWEGGTRNGLAGQAKRQGAADGPRAAAEGAERP
jgi:hypothetical protein